MCYLSTHTHLPAPPCPPAPHTGGKELRQEDITPNAPSLVVYSRKGYIKRMSADTFSVQGKGGKGEPAALRCCARTAASRC